MNGKITYRQQFTRCGKQRCRKCREGTGHGPYWYAYWSENGRTVSKYIGSTLPKGVDIERVQQVAHHHETTQAASTTQITNTRTPTYALKIYLLGQFRIERKEGNEWKTVDGRVWHRRRARALLGCLLSSSGRRLGREQIMDQLWPDVEIEVAANRLNGAVHELRQLLEPDLERPANSRLLRLEHDVLELADSRQIWVDAEAFEQLLREADASTDTVQERRCLEKAASLYQGSYLLEELYSEWAIPRRDTLQRAWVGLLLNLAERQNADGEFTSAIETLDRLRSADPTNETALQRLMTLLTQRDRRGEALKIYQQHVTMLQKEYESEPLPETVALYERLRYGHLPVTEPLASEPLQLNQTPMAADGDVTATSSVTSTQPLQTQPAQPAPVPQQPLRLQFKRPLFQLGRHNQSRLIGREQELDKIKQVLLALDADRPSTSDKLNRQTQPTHTTANTTEKNHLAQSYPELNHHNFNTLIHFILLHGESGIGKTRLAEEMSIEADQRGWVVVWSRSYEQESSIPYHPWSELLRIFFQHISTVNTTDSDNEQADGIWSYGLDTLPLKMERLSALLPDQLLSSINNQGNSTLTPIIHEQERLHLWEAALGLIEAISQRYPLLFVLDDLHWADDSSIELLTYLIHHLQHQRVLFVGTSREGELSPQHKLRALINDMQREQAIAMIPVLPLSNAEIGTLVSYLPQKLIQTIQAQAAGNPFFAEELARGATTPQTDRAVQAEQAETMNPLTQALSLTQSPARNTSMPETISAMLERRLNRLSTSCQILLGKAAILGGSFELRQLLPMVNDMTEDTVLDLLEEALEAGLISEEGTGAHIVYHFWHPLIISHLYGRLSAARRAQLHRKAAATLQSTTPQPELVAATIVYHLTKGGGNLPSLAYYAEQASKQAYKLGAYAEAQRYYLRVLQAQSNNTLYENDTSNVHEHIQQILAQPVTNLPLADPPRTYRMLECAAECSIILGDFDEGRRLYEYILVLRTSEPFQRYQQTTTDNPEALKRTEAQIQALIWREISNTWVAISDYRAAYTSFQHGKEVMQKANVTSGAAWACLQIHYGAMLRIDGNYHEARRYLQEGLAMLESSVQEHAAAGTAHQHEGNQSPTRIERALAGDPLEIGYAHERLGIVAASLGEINSALEHLHTTLNIYKQNELITEMARVSGNLGAVYILKGEHKTGRALMQQALELAERGGELPTLTFIMINLGDTTQRSGELATSESWFRQSLTVAERINDRESVSWANIALANVQKDQGHLKDASNSICQAITTARAIKNARCLHYALVILADIHITQAIAQPEHPQPATPTDALTLPAQTHAQQRKGRTLLLQRAYTLLQRAHTMTAGVEIETIIEGQHQLAMAQFLLHDNENAYQTANQAQQDAIKHETTQIIGRLYLLLGRIQAARGMLPSAEEYFQQALSICQQHDFNLDYAHTLHHYGYYILQQTYATETASCEKQSPAALAQQQQRYQDGLARLQEAQRLFKQCHAELDLVINQRTLAELQHLRHSQFIPTNELHRLSIEKG
jgi:Predicted ATPase